MQSSLTTYCRPCFQVLNLGEQYSSKEEGKKFSKYMVNLYKSTSILFMTPKREKTNKCDYIWENLPIREK